jgi:prolipoprotein diacylglyceryl transferase
VVVAAIPSPDGGTISVGPLEVRAYGLLIALGVIAAIAFADRRYRARGGAPGTIAHLATWCVPAGILGARAYHVATDWHLYRDRPLDALRVWDGGLGIWGGIAAGVIAGVLIARRHTWAVGPLLDAAAPAIPLAQAIGRWGNWFNQELFGRPTTLPWGLEIDPAHRPDAYAAHETFHPTFLYESLWCLATVAIVLWAERRAHLRTGRLFAVYVVSYTLGRFWIELLRVDPAHRFVGLRLNDWTSLILCAVALAVLARDGRRGAGGGYPAPAPRPADRVAHPQEGASS